MQIEQTKPTCCSNCVNTSEFNYIKTVEADDYKLFCFECLECRQLILKKGDK